MRGPQRLQRAVAEASSGPWAGIGALAAKQLRTALPGRKASAPVGPEAVPPVSATVRAEEREHAAFCRVVGAVPGTRVHSAFLHRMAFPVSTRLMASADFPLPPLGLVHLSNTMEQYLPVEFGQEVTIWVRVSSFGEHRRGRTATLEATGWDDAGREVFRDVSVYLAKEPRAAGSSTQGSGREGRAEPHPDPREGAQLVASWRLPADMGRRYAGVSGDVNPIHLSSVTARALGMPGMIVHGMYCAARALNHAAQDPSAPGRWEIEFGAPVRLPGTVRIWRVTEPEGASAREGTELRGVGAGTRRHFVLRYRSGTPAP